MRNRYSEIYIKLRSQNLYKEKKSCFRKFRLTRVSDHSATETTFSPLKGGDGGLSVHRVEHICFMNNKNISNDRFNGEIVYGKSYDGKYP